MWGLRRAFASLLGATAALSAQRAEGHACNSTDFQTPLVPYLIVDVSSDVSACRGRSCAVGVLLANALLEACQECDLVILPASALSSEVLGYERALWAGGRVAPGHVHGLLGAAGQFQAARVGKSAVEAYFNASVASPGQGFPQLSQNVQVRVDTNGGVPSISSRWRDWREGCSSFSDLPESLVVGAPAGLLAGEVVVPAEDSLAAAACSGLARLGSAWDLPADEVLEAACGSHESAVEEAAPFCPVAFSARTAPCFSFRLLYTGSILGRSLPTRPDGSADEACYNASTGVVADECWGGAERRGKYLRAVHNRSNGSVVILDGGNYYGRGDFEESHEGVAEGHLMSMQPYTAMGLSYKDFQSQKSARNVKNLFESYSRPVLLSNVRTASDWAYLENLTSKFHVESLAGGQRIGIVSVLSSLLTESTLVQDQWDFNPAGFDDSFCMEEQLIVMNTISVVNEMKRLHNPDIVVAMLDLDARQAAIFLQNVGNVDAAIVTNDLPWEIAEQVYGPLEDSEWSVDQLSVESKAVPGKRIPVLGVPWYGAHVGSAILDVDADRDVIRWRAAAVPMDNSSAAEEDPHSWAGDINGEVHRYFQESQALLGETVITMPQPLEWLKLQCRQLDCPMQRLYADAAYHSCGGKCDFAFLNAGAIRSGFSGEISMVEIFQMLPYGGDFVVKQMNGSDLKSALAHGATQCSGGGYPAFAGLRLARSVETPVDSTSADLCVAPTIVDPTATGSGSYVSSQVCKRGAYSYSDCSEWISIENGQQYTVVTSNYLAAGGDGYQALGAAEELATISPRDARAAIREFLLTEAEDHLSAYWSLQTTIDKCTGNTEKEGWSEGCRVIDTSAEADADFSGLCSPGFRFDSQLKECFECPAGKESSYDSQLCLDCTVGRAAAESGMSLCTECAPGTFQNISGQLSCIACEAGRFAGEPASATCQDCPAGRWSDGSGDGDDEDDGSGGAGSEKCTVCPVGEYQDSDEEGAASCKKCDDIILESTTILLGAATADRCLCPPDFFFARAAAGAAAECRACPEGLLCDDFGIDPPKQAEGFHAGPQAHEEGSLPEFTVVCSTNENCPAGRPLGQCEAPREGLACDKCPVGFYDDGEGQCMECGSGTGVAPVVACLVVAAGLTVALSVYVTRPTSVSNTALLTVALSGSLIVTAFQTLAVFQQLRISWVEPMRSLQGVVLLLTFEIDILNPECVFRSNSSALTYLFSLLVYPVFALGLLLVLSVFKKLGRDVKAYQVWNAQGNIVMLIYPSLAMMALMPLRCSSNPDESMSLISERSILCWSGDHSAMIVLSVIAILLYIIAFVSYVAWVVWMYPVRMVRDGAVFVRQSEFLFRRFRADRYYYALMFVIRNLLMAMAPVVFADLPAMQGLSMSFVLIIIFGCVCYLLPWRTSSANFLDCVIAICLLMILNTGMVLSPLGSDSVEVIIQVILAILLVGIFGLGLGVAAYNFKQSIFPPKRYGVFLSHHKGGAQLLARWFKQQLCDSIRDDVFLDSDNLQEMFSLLHTAAFETKNLVILLTAETLLRPWCACEIVSAAQNSVNVVLVSCDGTLPPDDDRIAKLQEIWTEPQLAEFASLGIAKEDITDAYERLRGKTVLNLGGSKGLSGEIVDQLLGECKDLSRVRRFGSASLASGSIPSAETTSGDDRTSTGVGMEVLLVGSVEEMESACCAQVVKRLLSVKLQVVVEVGHHSILQGQLSASPHVVILLRRELLSDVTFAATSVHAVRHNLTVTPLLADGAFRFPDQEFWHNLEAGRVFSTEDSPLLDGVSLHEVATAYKAIFKIIAVKFTENGSEAIQVAEINELAKRIKVSDASKLRRGASAGIATMNSFSSRAGT
ncbi:unnamed protein product [Prorocentrum cordatum]|uniref:Uncharacterized protein n=1 Tax=Prorocentrum cordatum TaxID=2364126 RepID=A0ABN9TI94_9DINO|nr:unnamed protein product [Polarella glacialis]